MPIKLYWDNEEKHILRCDVIGHWSSEDFMQIVKQGQQFLNSVPHTVHLVFDWSQNRRKPTRVIELARRAEADIPPNFGLMVVVGADSFIQSLMMVVQKLAPRATRNLYFTDTLDEAYTLIRSQSTKPNLNPVL